MAVVVPTVVIAVPMVVVLHAAAGAVPVPVEIASPLIAWSNPSGFRVRYAGPISFMPPIVMSNGVPVTFDPNETGARTDRADAQHTGRRRGTDCDSN
jgi:hypothetical protein